MAEQGKGQQMLPFSTSSSRPMAPPGGRGERAQSRAAPRTAAIPWSRAELDEIGRALDTPLTGEEIARRVGAGGKKFSYIEGWFVLDQCNRIFGATGWSCEIKDIQVRVRPDKNKGFYAKARVISRVTLKDGTFHEDISVAGKYNKNESDAEMMACKTAVTDARKRVLRCFGRALGNSVYDKTSLAASRKRPASSVVSRVPPAYNRNREVPQTKQVHRPNLNPQKQQQTKTQDQRNHQHQQQPKPRRQEQTSEPQQVPSRSNSSGPPVDRTNLDPPSSVAASFIYSVPQSGGDSVAETPDPTDALFGDDDDQLYADLDLDNLRQENAKRQRISA